LIPGGIVKPILIRYIFGAIFNQLFLKPVFRCVDRGLMVSLVGPYSSVPGACARQFQWKSINKGFPHWLLFKEILHAHGFHWKWTMQEPQPHGGDCGVSNEIKLKFIKISEEKI
jgi:hypothetical protein